MKLMHLSDLHIGKRVNDFSMIEDQIYILKQILEILDRECVDGVILAGDIYDKPVPSVEAVQVFDAFLTSLADRKLPVFLISGNHDSAERIGFGAQLMDSREIYIAGVYDGTVKEVVLKDLYGEVSIFLLPFLKPSIVRHGLLRRLEKQEQQDCADEVSRIQNLSSYQDCVRAVVDTIQIPDGRRSVLIAHQFVRGAACCESEELMVGGVDQVDASVFDRFDYVALGHLHSPQKAGRESIRYCGTQLKYSFSEASQQKSVTIAELGEKGSIEIRTVPLVPLHDMRKIRGTYLEVTAKSFYEGSATDDYLLITLTDEEDIPDGLLKLRTIYPNLMRLEYDNRRTREERLVEADHSAEKKTALELFEEFYELQNNQPVSEEQQSFVKKLILLLQEEQGQERSKS